MTLKKKIVLLGDSAVGKTSLIRRYVFDQFEDSYISTIGSKVTMKELRIQTPMKKVDLTLMIWDIIGREGYHALQARTFVGVHGAILVADLTRKDTLGSLERYWIPSLYKVVEDVPLVFACNKSDLVKDHEFELGDLEDVASKYTIGYDDILPADVEPTYSTSAKDGSSVETLFKSLGHLVTSEKGMKDPVKELFEGLVATGITRTSDKTTPVGALDAIIVDFCKGFKDSRMSMLVLRQEIARAGIDINDPTRDGVIKAVEFLAEADSEFKNEKKVRSNLERWREIAYGIKE
ncbi:MAG: GTP-binding protein [Thermoplasmata archaeon]|nr:GTP-binding protein [Thermoplasmata archaeon]